MLYQIVNTVKIVKQPFAQYLPKLKSGKLTLAFLKCIKCTHKESRVYTNFYMRKVYIIGDYCVMRVRLLLEELRSSIFQSCESGSVTPDQISTFFNI